MIAGPASELHAQISPNGKWIAYDDNETGNSEIYVRPFPTGEGRRQLSIRGGVGPRWRQDGKELFYLTPSQKIASVKIDTSESTLNFSGPTELFDSGNLGGEHPGGSFLPFAISPDGQRFLISRSASATAADAAARPITVIVNWAPIRSQ